MATNSPELFENSDTGTTTYDIAWNRRTAIQPDPKKGEKKSPHNPSKDYGSRDSITVNQRFATLQKQQ